jgi:seryl-tRNA synthetase
MLQISVIRQNPDRIRQRLAIKNFSQPELIDELLKWDEKRRQYQAELDELQSGINQVSREIGQLMAKGEKEKAEEKKKQVAELKSQQNPEKLTDAEKNIEAILYLLPNTPSEQVPAGKTPAENVIIREGGPKPALGKDAVPHWELTKKYDLIDFELGNKVTGSGFPFYKAKGAKLQRALIQYFLEYNIAAGYTEYMPPLMVNEASALGTGQLPDKEGQMYHAPEDAFYLIPTSEVPLTNIYRDTILKVNELPLRMTAYTPCFRREAGSYGKDVRGLNRLHQFDKVEIVQVVHPQKSYEALDEMVNHVEELLKTLELPYRILKLCGGDMSFASAITYDFEVFSAAQERWLEVSSVSNFETFQSNRMKVRFKDAEGKTQLVHTLNGSSLALPRIVACLLENHQRDNYIGIPASLQKYFGSDRID